MDKKELQNLIDRISLTGPEGIKKIKKALKEISDSSSGSMGEDEEYTTAQALNDLNERIKGLKTQIAQQDYNILATTRAFDEPTELIADLSEKILNAFAGGILLNTVIVNTESGDTTRIVSFEVYHGELYSVSYIYGASVFNSTIE